MNYGAVVGGYTVFLCLISIFVVVYLVCFYTWLRVLISRKVTIYNDGDNIIIIIIIIIIIVFFFGLRFKFVLLVLLWLS